MSVIAESKYSAEIVWLGSVDPSASGIRSRLTHELPLGWEGAAGSRHAGRTCKATMRVKLLHPNKEEIANVRQLSIVSEEEIEAIATAMGMTWIDPEWLGASMVLRGIPDFSHVPPSSRLQGPDGCTLVVDMYNAPCTLPGREIEQDHPGMGKSFRPAAKGLRGVTAWVERPGILRPGDVMRLIVPTQRAWAPE